MQATIAVVTAGAYFVCARQWAAAATFFVVMQVGAVAGAAWAARLRGIMERRTSALLRPRN